MQSGPAFCQYYLNDTIKILDGAGKMSLHIEGADLDTQLYLSRLRETLIDCYTSIVHGVTES